MSLGAILLSFVTVAIDGTLGSKWLDDVSWFYANRPDGARSLLSTVAGSMITVAGVTFSLTIMSLSHTTSTVGPRLLNNFMSDRANQFTLGVFVSTFLYCLMVLRTVRSAEGNSDPSNAFVPHIAVLVGILLAVSSVGVLIFFIHHVSDTLNVENIISRVGRGLIRTVESEFAPESDDEAREKVTGSDTTDDASKKSQSEIPTLPDSQMTPIQASHTGYVSYVDYSGLLSTAQENDLLIRVRFRTGDFVTPSKTLMLAGPNERVTDEVRSTLKHTFVYQDQRTEYQDLRFQINQLVQVAARALSPGVNDPFTAMNCMDWLQAALERMSVGCFPPAIQFDDEDHPRIVSDPDNFKAFADLVFSQLRTYSAADHTAALHLIEMMAKVQVSLKDEKQMRTIVLHAAEHHRLCEQQIADRKVLAKIRHRYVAMIRILRSPEYRDRIMEHYDWLGGRA